MDVCIIDQTVFIPAPPEAVYKALTDPDIHARFTKTRVFGNPEISGKYTAGDEYISGKYLELVPPLKIVIEWSTQDWPAHTPPSVIEFTFHEKENGTELRMIQTGTPKEQFELYSKGWMHHYWHPMIEYFKSRKRTP